MTIKIKEVFTMNEHENKKEGLTNKEKLMLAGGIVASTGLAVMGFKFGRKYECALIAKGFEKCWEVDPTLKSHMWETVGKVYASLS